MPELPEVETVKNDLRPLLLKKRIVDVEVRLPKIVKVPVAQFVRRVTGAQIHDVRRRAKILLIDLENGATICIHLKMSGQLILASRRGLEQVGGHQIVGGTEHLPNKYTHVIFRLNGSHVLYFNDLRQFGYLTVMRTVELEKFFSVKKLGPEPFQASFNFAYFVGCLQRKRKTTIKTALLDQSMVVGLGNIYTDEVLFAARVKPTRRVISLHRAEKRAIYDRIKSVLRTAIRLRGTTFRHFRDGHGRSGGMLAQLMVYGRSGELCRRCKKGKIQKTRLGSRSSCYCPVCQR
ncbi:MAG: bifunctional DNA-formamidopyrimidine glycosylase/DNA-(apurinic or apyrimidinic site) lyase [Patescibacteria group bacterium]